MKLKTRAWTTSQPPQSSSDARVRSVRGARRVSQRPATSTISAAGSSHEIWPPKDSLNIRVMPVEPPKPVLPLTAAAPAAVALAAEDAAQAVVAEDQVEERLSVEPPM